MSFFKRFLMSFFAFVVMACGSLSFMPKSSAVDSSVHFDITENEVLSLGISHPYYFIFATGNQPGGVFTPSIYVIFSDTAFTVTRREFSSSYPQYYDTLFGDYRNGFQISTSGDLTSVHLNKVTGRYEGSPFVIASNVTYNNSYTSNQDKWSYTFDTPSFSKPYVYNFMPFYFPELPTGIFDGNINLQDGKWNLEFPDISSWSGSFDIGVTVSDSQQGANGEYDTHTWQDSNYPGSYTLVCDSAIPRYLEAAWDPDYNKTCKFRCWSCVMDSSYVYFISDTRNTITATLDSCTSDEITWSYHFADSGSGNSLYPVTALVFTPYGALVQALAPTSEASGNKYTCTCSIGSLVEAENNRFTVDPDYYGFWFSDNSPPLQHMDRLVVDEDKLYLANPVFGETGQILMFLDSINNELSSLNSNIQSFQSAMQSSISNQTNSLINQNTPSDFNQSSMGQTSDLESLEASMHAPSTDSIFRDNNLSTFTDGMGFWRDRMNELLYFNNSPVLALTIFSLTLGLAAMIIGRRVSGGGSA